MGEKFVVSQVSTVNEWGVAEIEIDFELQMCPQINAYSVGSRDWADYGLLTQFDRLKNVNASKIALLY